MNKLLFIFCVITLLACGSKKKFNKVDSVENSKSTGQLYAELYWETRLLEFLDVKVRQVETIDISGNVRKETNIDISRKVDRQDLDTTKVTVSKYEQKEKVSNMEIKEERSGVVRYWFWGAWGMMLIVVTFAVCVKKK